MKRFTLDLFICAVSCIAIYYMDFTSSPPHSPTPVYKGWSKVGKGYSDDCQRMGKILLVIPFESSKYYELYENFIKKCEV